MVSDLDVYRVSGRALKRDFDFMLRDLLSILADHAGKNEQKLEWPYTREVILDYINAHRRRIAHKYAVRLRDVLDLEHALREYGKFDGKE